MNNKPATKTIPTNPKRCPLKHSRAYKTSFGQLYCPDCENNINEEEE